MKPRVGEQPSGMSNIHGAGAGRGPAGEALAVPGEGHAAVVLAVPDPPCGRSERLAGRARSTDRAGFGRRSFFLER